MNDPLYRKELLRLAADAHGAGRLVAPHTTGQAYNPACGDRVIVDLILDHGRVVEMAHETKACILAQASAALLAQSARGTCRADIEKLHDAIVCMLDSHGPAPIDPFADYAALDGAADFTNRHGCVLLPLDAMLHAFDASGLGEPRRIRPEA